MWELDNWLFLGYMLETYQGTKLNGRGVFKFGKIWCGNKSIQFCAVDTEILVKIVMKR